MPSFETHIQFDGGVRIGTPNLFAKDADTNAFCSIRLGLKRMDRPERFGPTLSLIFDDADDIAELASALTELAHRFRAFVAPDDATVPIGEDTEAASMPITTVLGGES